MSKSRVTAVVEKAARALADFAWEGRPRWLAIGLSVLVVGAFVAGMAGTVLAIRDYVDGLSVRELIQQNLFVTCMIFLYVLRGDR